MTSVQVAKFSKPLQKEIFLSRMEQILPWQNMTAVIEPFYPKAGNGRRPYPL
ncbi:hypothetical protein M1V27_22620, partial [Escherichia coli]|nr:hypothetical protein [Escherichia coli]